MLSHDRLGHLPFVDMFKLAESGRLPEKYLELKGKMIICPSYLFVKAKRRAWRSCGDYGSIRKLTQVNAGDGTSIDQVISAHAGLVPRLDGRHTCSRIHCGTVFMDHVYTKSFTHLQCSTGDIETIAAKSSCELYTGSLGVTIKFCHADNGILAEKSFRDEVDESNQKINFCAVGDHHQNGIIESHVGFLTRGSRCILLHDQRRWPNVITTLLWPFSWKDDERRRNEIHTDLDNRSPLARFSGVDWLPELKNYHTWGCPTYVLDDGLQDDGSKIPKWDPRSRLGIYLGQSSWHTGNVALVLNPKTLHVSPQYHVVFDDDFLRFLF